MGWGFRVSEFCFFFLLFFCQVWLQQKNILFGLLKVSQARLELAADGGGGPPDLSVYCGMEKPSIHRLGVQGANVPTLPSVSVCQAQLQCLS
jgi:hypothetical protein